MNTEIPVGLRNNQLITVYELKEDEWGQRCQCVCPQCHKPLVAVRGQGKKFFRHKMNEMHCHYHYDEFALQYIWEILENLGFVEGMNLDLEDLHYFRVLPKLVQQQFQKQNGESKAFIHDIHKDEKSFKISIMNQDYTIKLVFHAKDKENHPQDIVIDCSELEGIDKTIYKYHKESLQESLIEKIDHQISKVCEHSQDSKSAVSHQELGQIIKLLPQICPICGSQICRRKSRIDSVIVCSNPDCGILITEIIKFKNK